MFDSVDNPSNIVWFLMGDFLKLSPWSGECRKRSFCNKGFFCCRFLETKTLYCHTLYIFP